MAMDMKAPAARPAERPRSSKMLTMWNCRPVPSIEMEASPSEMIQKAEVRIASERPQFSSTSVAAAARALSAARFAPSGSSP
jgi:hypothetical protein